MKDEEYIYRQENREKAQTARSARNRRTHCGKGGRVKLPSDYMTKKELQKMNGEVNVYRLNEPMTWNEFKAMPDEHKVSYIKLLRRKWNVSDKYIAQMMQINQMYLSRELQRLGLNTGSRSGRIKWDKEGFLAWVHGIPTEAIEETVDEPVEESVENPVEEVKEETPHAIPHTGNLYFEGNIEDVMNTLGVLLSGARVGISIRWDVLEVEHG